MMNQYPIPRDAEIASSPYVRPHEKERRRRSRLPSLFFAVVLLLIGVLVLYHILPDEVKTPLNAWLFGAEGTTGDGTSAQTTPQTGTTAPEPDGTTDIYEWQCELPSGATAILPVNRSANALGSFSENPTDAPLDAVLPKFVRAADGKISVLIVNTHSYEAYSAEGMLYFTDSVYASDNDENRNVAVVCRSFADALNENGIGAVFVDCVAESSLGSYRNAARMIELALEEYPDVCLVVDIHRGVMTDETGAVLRPVAQSFEETLAQVKLIVGADASFETNAAAALALFENASAVHRELMMPTEVSNGALLQALPFPVLTVEIGTCGNYVSEAERSARLLAEVIARMMTEAAE